MTPSIVFFIDYFLPISANVSIRGIYTGKFNKHRHSKPIYFFPC
jgi:hypothetical protein